MFSAAPEPTATSSSPPGGPMLDLTIENITPNVQHINSVRCPDARTRYLMDRLVSHLHDFARETRLSSAEWMEGLDFLAETGKMCSDVRHEFILLSDILGLSLLVDSIDHPKPPSSTEGTVLGPFHTDQAPLIANGGQMSQDEAGEPMLCVCTVRDSATGKPIPDVLVDIWETDSTGMYDVQHTGPGGEGPAGPDGRCLIRTDSEGRFWFRGIRPVPYPIPNDGPVGKLLGRLGRHCWRPAHVHFLFNKERYDKLVTALYVAGDKYCGSDAVFGVKKSLIVELGRVTDAWLKEEGQPTYEGVKVGDWLLQKDFVLVTEQESSDLREQKAKEAMDKLGLKMRLEHGLPVPLIDASDLD